MLSASMLFRSRRSLVVVLVSLVATSGVASAQIITPYVNAGTVVNNASFGSVPWTDPQNATGSDNNYATAGSPLASTQYLVATNFGLSMPADAVLQAIVVHVERHATTTSVTDAQVRIVKGGVIGSSNFAMPLGDWFLVDVNQQYNHGLWGETWTVADIASPGFGFAFAASFPGFTGTSALVDNIRISLVYLSDCQNGAIDGVGEECDEGAANGTPGSCCTSTCKLRTTGSQCRPAAGQCDVAESCDGASPVCPADLFVPDQTSCDDGQPGTLNDVCTAGTCAGTPGGCPSTPQTGCREPAAAKRSVLVARDRSVDAKDLLRWTWRQGAATTLADFGDPEGTTDYAFCVYDESSDVPVLAMGAEIPAGTNWKPIDRGFKYKAKDALPDGVRVVVLKQGGAGKASVSVEGSGSQLDLSAFPLAQDTRFHVQLLNSDGECWGATFTAPPAANEPGIFKDKSD